MPGRGQRANLTHYLGWPRRLHGFGRRRQCHTAAFTHDLLQSIPLLRFQIAELILHVIAILTRKIHQLLGVDVQFARQGIDSDFLTVWVQAGSLLYRQPPRPRSQAGFEAALSVHPILTAPTILKRESFVPGQNLLFSNSISIR